MPDAHQPNLPLDERFRQAEQHAFDFPEAGKQTAATPPIDYEKPSGCNPGGYCYCPKCNPR